LTQGSPLIARFGPPVVEVAEDGARTATYLGLPVEGRGQSEDDAVADLRARLDEFLQSPGGLNYIREMGGGGHGAAN